MAAIDWPSAPFPQIPLRRAWQQSQKPAVIRSTMGYGPDKLRRRTTAVISAFPVELVLDDTGRDTLLTFYETTTVSGTLRFNWTDFLTGNAVEMRFLSPIAWREITCSSWAASMQLEILP